jgi:hypothetical protein
MLKISSSEEGRKLIKKEKLVGGGLEGKRLDKIIH